MSKQDDYIRLGWYEYDTPVLEAVVFMQDLGLQKCTLDMIVQYVGHKPVGLRRFLNEVGLTVSKERPFESIGEGGKDKHLYEHKLSKVPISILGGLAFTEERVNWVDIRKDLIFQGKRSKTNDISEADTTPILRFAICNDKKEGA